jgi:hypothetical protein
MSELCGELWLETGSPFLSTGDDMTQEAGLASDLNRELGTIESTKKWKCKDCGGTENHDHRGCNLMFKEIQRFYVDERVGCIAVRDRTKDEKWFSGLSRDTEGVRGYWTGVRQEDEKGNFKQWYVLDSQRKEAAALCDLLNTGA